MTDKEKIIEAVESMLNKLTPVTESEKVENLEQVIHQMVRIVVSQQVHSKQAMEACHNDKQYILAAMHEGSVVTTEDILLEFSYIGDDIEAIVEYEKGNLV